MKHHFKTPRRPGLLSPYKRAGRGTTRNKGQWARHKIEINISSNHPCPLFFLSLRLGLDALSRKLVTPTRAPRCKEIQTSPSPLDVGPSFARTRINPRVFSLHHHPGKGHAAFTRRFRAPRDRTPTVGAPGRGRCVLTSFSGHFSGWLTPNALFRWLR
jgi:hypothetical protein